MQVSLNKPDTGLEHTLTVSFPSDDLTATVEKKLSGMCRTVKMDGFRPGKVPLKVIKKQYGGQVHQEAFGEAVQGAFYKAVTDEALNIAGYPAFNDVKENDGRISFVATFDVYPEITIPNFADIKVEKITSTVTDADIDSMITKLQEQRQAWKPANGNTKAKSGVQVIIDFVGKLDGVEFDGGQATNAPLILGSDRMIPGFEDGIIGMKKGETKQIDVTFPEDYQSDELKGKAVTFDITVHSVQIQQLPDLDEEFIKSFGVEDGTEASLRTEIKDNMVKELSRAVDNKNRTNVLEALSTAIDIELPTAALEEEKNKLMERAVQNMQQQGVQSQDVNVSIDEFTEEATVRVKLGLILGDIIKQNSITAEESETVAFIEEQASSYDDPTEVINWYQSNPQAMAEIRSVIIEKQIANMILDTANVTEVTKAFNEIVTA